MGLFDDNFLSDIQGVVSDAAKGIVGDASSFIKNTTSEALVRIGPKPAGNLSAAEISAGATGAPPQGSVVSKVTSSLNSKMVLPLVIGGAIILVLVLRRR